MTTQRAIAEKRMNQLTTQLNDLFGTEECTTDGVTRLIAKRPEPDDENYYQYFQIIDQLYEQWTIILSCKKDATRQVMKTEMVRQMFTKSSTEPKMLKYLFVTVSPMEGIVTPIELLGRINSFMKSPCVAYGFAVIEQRSDSEEIPFHGYHCHLLFKRDRKPCVVKKALSDNFQDMCQTTHHINVQSHKNADDCYGRYDYINGHKKTPGKDLKVERDFVMREEFGIPHLIAYGDPKPLVRIAKAKAPLLLRSNVQIERVDDSSDSDRCLVED